MKTACPVMLELIAYAEGNVKIKIIRKAIISGQAEFGPEVQGKQERNIKVILNPDIPGGKNKQAAIVIHLKIVCEIDTSKASSSPVIPVEIAVKGADPLIQPGEFEGVKVSGVPPPQVGFQPIGPGEGFLVGNFGPEPVAVPKPEAKGMV